MSGSKHETFVLPQGANEWSWNGESCKDLVYIEDNWNILLDSTDVYVNGLALMAIFMRVQKKGQQKLVLKYFISLRWVKNKLLLLLATLRTYNCAFQRVSDFPASSLAQRLPYALLLKLIFIITNKTVS